MKNSLTHIEGILFDYGGTLDTPGRHWAHVLWEGYRHADIPVEEADFRKAYVYGERALATRKVVESGDTFHDVLLHKVALEADYLCDNALWTCTRGERDQAVACVAAYADAYARRTVEQNRPFLDRLSERYPLVLVTNFYGNMPAVLAEYGIDRYFRHVVESARVGVRKPDPAIYRLGVEALGLEPAGVLAVGDSYDKDIVPAAAVGCRTAWLKGEGWDQGQPVGDRADVVLSRLDELVTVWHLCD